MHHFFQHQTLWVKGLVSIVSIWVCYFLTCVMLIHDDAIIFFCFFPFFLWDLTISLKGNLVSWKLHLHLLLVLCLLLVLWKTSLQEEIPIRLLLKYNYVTRLLFESYPSHQRDKYIVFVSTKSLVSCHFLGQITKYNRTIKVILFYWQNLQIAVNRFQ